MNVPRESNAVDLAVCLAQRPRRWLLTGSAGFIGSHLLEALLHAGQHVTSVDDFSSGRRAHLDAVRSAVGEHAWSRHRFIEGDVADPDVCRHACEGIEIVLHQAAMTCAWRAMQDPLAAHRANVTGFANVLFAACEAGVQRCVYAASSSVYTDSLALPRVEDKIGRLGSPYAATKYMNELYADVFARCYGIETIGLRYFTVFGPRQDAETGCAAVIPRWVAQMLAHKRSLIPGDGETSRDYCFIANAVQATLRAALTENQEALNQVYNVAVGERTTLNQLHESVAAALGAVRGGLRILPPEYGDFRPGDVRHSLADIGKARRLLGYSPTHNLQRGLREAIGWYVSQAALVT